MPIVRPQILLAVYAAVAAIVAAFYFVQYPVPGFFERIVQVGTAGAFLLGLASIGRRLFRGWGWEPGGGDGGRFLWCVGVGGIPASLGLLLLGAAGGFRPAAIGALSLAAVVWSGRDLLHWLVRARAGLRAVAAATLTPGAAALAAVAGGISLLLFLCALAPPTYYDSLVYHLALPAKYLQEGRIGFVPYNHYSHFPQNMELIFGWFLALGDDVSAQLFNAGLAVLNGAVLLSLVRRWEPKASGWALWIFMTAPCTLLLSSETYVEAPLALWTTLSLAAAARGLRGEEGDRRWFILSGLLGGFAAGIKYTGALTPALLSLLVLVWPGPRPARRRWAEASLLGGAAFVVFLPWLVKNTLLTGGNPVFPFLPSVFPASRVALAEESARAYFKVFDEYKGTSTLLLELFKLPWRAATDALSLGGGYDVTGDMGWALPLLLLPLGAAAVKKNPSLRLPAAYFALHALLWGSLRPVLRFLYPLLPLACLLAGAGAARLPRPGRVAAAVFCALFALSNTVLFYVVERVRDPFPQALGIESRDEYLSRKIDAYPPLAFINKNLPEDARVLFAGDQRGYYCGRPYLAPMVLLPPPLVGWADEAGTGEVLRGRLRELGFTHLLFHRREAARLKATGALDFSERGRAAWEELLELAEPLHDSGSAAVYRL